MQSRLEPQVPEPEPELEDATPEPKAEVGRMASQPEPEPEPELEDATPEPKAEVEPVASQPEPEPEPELESDAGSNRYCRICYDPDRPGDKLFSPCLCKGSCQFIHVSCLNTWRHQYEPSHRNFTECDLCHYKYRLYRPMISRILLSPQLLLLASAVATGLFTIVCGAVAIKVRRVATCVPTPAPRGWPCRELLLAPLQRCVHFSACAVVCFQVVRRPEKPTASCGTMLFGPSTRRRAERVSNV